MRRDQGEGEGKNESMDVKAERREENREVNDVCESVLFFHSAFLVRSTSCVRGTLSRGLEC